MTNAVKCPKCNGNSYLHGEIGSMELYVCSSCGNNFNVRSHYVEKFVSPLPKAFRATVDASDENGLRKLKIKVKKVFSGRSNFYVDSLEKQIKQELKIWDLGFYSENEVVQIQATAKEFDLNVQFAEDDLV